MHIQSKHSKKNENKNMQTEVQLHVGFFSLVGKKEGTLYRRNQMMHSFHNTKAFQFIEFNLSCL